jgi:membrane protease YdiL (CAAX protease family)
MTGARGLIAIALAFAAVVLVTGIASPLVLAALGGAGAGVSFEETTVRLLELTAIAATFPLLAASGGSSRPAWGLPRRPGAVARLLAGLGLGIASLSVVCAALFVTDVRVTRLDLPPEPGYWMTVAAGAVVSAAVVAAMEELWFRGGLFTLLQRVLGAVPALWAGAATYAAAHFLEVPSPVDPDSAEAGFQVLGHAVTAMFSAANLDSFVALLVAGLLLGIVRMRQGDVMLCIGIHAGWVLTIKVFKKLTYVSPDSGLRWLAGHYDDLVGWLAAAVLAVTLLAIWRWLPAADTVEP